MGSQRDTKKERPRCKREREREGRLWDVVCCAVDLQSRCGQDPSRCFRSDLLDFLSCGVLPGLASVPSVPWCIVHLPVLFSLATQLARPTTSHSPASKEIVPQFSPGSCVGSALERVLPDPAVSFRGDFCGLQGRSTSSTQERDGWTGDAGCAPWLTSPSGVVNPKDPLASGAGLSNFDCQGL